MKAALQARQPHRVYTLADQPSGAQAGALLPCIGAVGDPVACVASGRESAWEFSKLGEVGFARRSALPQTSKCQYTGILTCKQVSRHRRQRLQAPWAAVHAKYLRAIQCPIPSIVVLAAVAAARSWCVWPERWSYSMQRSPKMLMYWRCCCFCFMDMHLYRCLVISYKNSSCF